MSKLRPQTPRSEFYQLLDQILHNEKNTKEAFEKAVTIAREQQFTDTEIAMFMHDYLKDKIPKTTLGRWIKPLKPAQIEDSSISNEVHSDQMTHKEDIEESDTPRELEGVINNPQTEEEDEELTKKRLQKEIEKNKASELREQEHLRRISQLEEVEKKRSFTPATDYVPSPPSTFQWPEPDEDNTFVFKDITFDAFRLKLGPLKAGGNTKINVYLERVK